MVSTLFNAFASMIRYDHHFSFFFEFQMTAFLPFYFISVFQKQPNHLIY